MAPVDEGPSLAPSWMRKPANRPGTGQQAAEQTSKPAFSQVGQESYQPARPSRPRTYSAGPEPPSVTRSASLYPPKSTSPFTSPRYQSSYGDPQPSYSDSRPNRTLSLQPEMPRQAPNRLGSKDFPSLADSKHPMGYAPKGFTSSTRVFTNFTSALVDSDSRAGPSQQGAGSDGTGSSQAGGAQSSPDKAGSTASPSAPSSSTQQPSSSVNGQTQAAPGAWTSVAQGSGGTSSSGAESSRPRLVDALVNGGLGGQSQAGSSQSLTTDKLREQLAVKQSKQLIPVLAKKGDADGKAGVSSGSARLSGAGAVGGQTVLGTSGKATLLGTVSSLRNHSSHAALMEAAGGKLLIKTVPQKKSLATAAGIVSLPSTQEASSKPSPQQSAGTPAQPNGISSEHQAGTSSNGGGAGGSAVSPAAVTDVQIEANQLILRRKSPAPLDQPIEMPRPPPSATSSPLLQPAWGGSAAGGASKAGDDSSTSTQAGEGDSTSQQAQQQAPAVHPESHSGGAPQPSKGTALLGDGGSRAAAIRSPLLSPLLSPPTQQSQPPSPLLSLSSPLLSPVQPPQEMSVGSAAQQQPPQRSDVSVPPGFSALLRAPSVPVAEPPSGASGGGAGGGGGSVATSVSTAAGLDAAPPPPEPLVGSLLSSPLLGIPPVSTTPSAPSPPPTGAGAGDASPVVPSSATRTSATPSPPPAVFSVPAEEEAFLRALGWSDGEEDDAEHAPLTDEEIAAFRAQQQQQQQATASTSAGGGLSGGGGLRLGAGAGAAGAFGQPQQAGLLTHTSPLAGAASGGVSMLGLGGHMGGMGCVSLPPATPPGMHPRPPATPVTTPPSQQQQQPTHPPLLGGLWAMATGGSTGLGLAGTTSPAAGAGQVGSGHSLLGLYSSAAANGYYQSPTGAGLQQPGMSPITLSPSHSPSPPPLASQQSLSPAAAAQGYLPFGLGQQGSIGAQQQGLYPPGYGPALHLGAVGGTPGQTLGGIPFQLASYGSGALHHNGPATLGFTGMPQR